MQPIVNLVVVVLLSLGVIPLLQSAWDYVYPQPEEILSATSPAMAQDFLALMEWGRTKCGMTLPFDLQQRTIGARDIVAQEPIKVLGTVFIVPDKCLITTAKAIHHPSTYGLFNLQLASQSPERHNFYEKRKEYESAMLPLMLLHIMDEGNDGFFAPYVKVLPKDVDNFVCLWGDEEKTLLPFNTLVDTITICNFIRAVYDDICAAVPAFREQRSFTEWQRAWMLANSRHLALTVGGKMHTALAPIYDSFNHAMQANVCWKYSSDINGVGGKVMRMNVSDGGCYADEDFVVPAGVELRVSYAFGQSRPSQNILLLHYGFTLPCGWETRWRSLLSNRNEVAGSGDFDREAAWDVAATMCRDRLRLRTEKVAYELTASRDSEDDLAFLESVRQSLDQPGDSEASMWRAVLRLVSSVEFPLTISEAGPLLEVAIPASSEYNALNVLIGQWSVSLAWMKYATKMIVK